MDKSLELLKKLTDLNGISGMEHAVRDALKEEFQKLDAKIEYDNIGSIIGSISGDENGPKIAIAGHMDEIGFMVTKITDDGFINFHTIGGWWSQVMLAQQYDITTSSGKVYRAVMGSKPPHLLTPDERVKATNIETMYLDLGVKSKEEVLNLGIKLGDMVTPAIEFQVMANEDFLLAKAIDDRFGCGVMLEVLNNVKAEKSPNTVYAVGTVQEEVGCRGAKTTANLVKPDIVFALDVTIATDTPGMSKTCKMGDGPVILLFDSGTLGHKELRNFVLNVADELKIPYQIDGLTRGGTDASAMHVANTGAPAMSIGLASRYIHSHTSMISKSDYENTIKLITEVVKRLDTKTVQEIILK